MKSIEMLLTQFGKKTFAASALASALALTGCGGVGSDTESSSSSSAEVSSSSEIAISSSSVSSSSSISVSSSAESSSLESSSSVSSESSSEVISSSESSAVESSSSATSSVSTPSDLIISEDFESGAAGEAPAGWRTILGHGLVDFSRTPSPGSGAEIDATQAHSGSNSVKVSTSDGSAPHFIFQELPAGLTQLYVRAWVYSNVQLGGGSAGGPGDHAHFIGTLEVPGMDSGAELRFGLNQRAYMGGFMPTYSDSFTNLQTNGSIPANTWTCVEWAVEDKPDFDAMYIWVNDEQVMAAEALSDWQNGPRADFVNADSTKFVSFGWRQFGSVADVSSIWFDDIAVGTAKIGCN